jgi:DNA polymerase I-like protein with 3'-5' exonuclease and polymerase domains
VHLERVAAASFRYYDFNIGAFLVTDDLAIAEAIDKFLAQPPSTIASDIETRGLGAARFQITCVTVAFHVGNDIVSVLLDPLRRPQHRGELERLYNHAADIVFHNAAFDITSLYTHRLMRRDHIAKTKDTIVAARMVGTNSRAGRDLATLVTRFGLMGDDTMSMDAVFKVRGAPKKGLGYWSMDIDSPTYVAGAMADTVATLRLWGAPGVAGHGICTEVTRYINAASEGFGGRGVLTSADAETLVDDIQRVNTIIQARTARGYAVDTGYLDTFYAEHGQQWRDADLQLRREGMRPGQGIDIILALDAQGLLPPNWPRTDGGRLSADKKAMERLENLRGEARTPLVAAHQAWMNYSKTDRYVSKALENAAVTGRLHPEFHVLGASASGRMSAKDPEVQQFTDEARGVVVADDGTSWVSVDWKSIEPVVLATASGDGDFLAAMRAGHDPYEPVGQRAGVDRKAAKRLMLANLYGQGAPSASATHSIPEETVVKTFEILRDELPIMYGLIDELRAQSRRANYVTTLTGRVLNQDIYLPAEHRTVVKDYIAPNHFCQGSALDVLHAAILRLDDLGLSDHVHLWMHDEIVADDVIADELCDAMRTPPKFLVEAAARKGIEPFLAVDMNDVGTHWKSV